MYVILGRLPEAVESFETAVEIKPDFWDSYSHVLLARVLLHDFSGAAEAAAAVRGVSSCPSKPPESLACLATCLEIEMAGRWQEMLEPSKASCARDRLAPRPLSPGRASCGVPGRRLAGGTSGRGRAGSLPEREQGEGRI